MSSCPGTPQLTSSPRASPYTPFRLRPLRLSRFPFSVFAPPPQSPFSGLSFCPNPAPTGWSALWSPASTFPLLLAFFSGSRLWAALPWILHPEGFPLRLVPKLLRRLLLAVPIPFSPALFWPSSPSPPLLSPTSLSLLIALDDLALVRSPLLLCLSGSCPCCRCPLPSPPPCDDRDSRIPGCSSSCPWSATRMLHSVGVLFPALIVPGRSGPGSGCVSSWLLGTPDVSV